MTRTAQSSPTASTSDPAISYRMQKLDRLEASLERQLARRAAKGKAAQSAPAIVYQRAPSPVASAQHGDDEHEYSYSAHDEGDRDD